MPEYELYHFGVKGMKWGVRRYQNKDGTLTPAGKKRLNKDETKLVQINDRIFKDRLAAREISSDDPARGMLMSVLSDRVRSQAQRGEHIVNSMKKKGLISDKTSFADYTAKYEHVVIDKCRKYITEKYDIKNPTDDDVSYFLPAYVYGAI